MGGAAGLVVAVLHMGCRLQPTPCRCRLWLPCRRMCVEWDVGPQRIALKWVALTGLKRAVVDLAEEVSTVSPPCSSTAPDGTYIDSFYTLMKLIVYFIC